MSDVSSLACDALDFLEGYLPRDATARSDEEGRIVHADEEARRTIGADDGEAREQQNGLPFVTLTYAASLDSMIALAPGARTTLSGPETKSMTHYLRLRHDAILVGGTTAAVDNPALNCRYPQATLACQPRPVIVDPNGRWEAAGSKASSLAAAGAGKTPWVVTTSSSSVKDNRPGDSDADYVVVDEADSRGAIEWEGILRALWARGIQSVMIEGGATVINSLLAQPKLVNAVIITIAPTFLGQGGVAVSPVAKTAAGSAERTNAAWLDNTSWKQFGNDVVLCARLRS